MMRDVARRDGGIDFLEVVEWRRDQRAVGVSRGAVAMSCDTGRNEPRSLAAAQRKNPPRIAAGGFQAKQITLIKAPWLTGPVNRSSDFLSTDGTTRRPGQRVGAKRHPMTGSGRDPEFLAFVIEGRSPLQPQRESRGLGPGFRRDDPG
jgi:hypothetical protein